VIRFQPAILRPPCWIGADLNTTGHVAVAADPKSGKVVKLGKNIHSVQSHSQKNCTKLFRDGKLWKLKIYKTRERKKFKSAIHAISRQIVSFAETLGSGIKFEKLFSARCTTHRDKSAPVTFSFANGSFLSLQHMVERRAAEHGIPVIYVNPAYTSKRCSRCGGYGRRIRKRFECPHCGYVAHADVNAAFNIAAASLRNASGEYLAHGKPETVHVGKKELRRQIRTQVISEQPAPVVANCTSCENHLIVLG
jgi:putative transposase